MKKIIILLLFLVILTACTRQNETIDTNKYPDEILFDGISFGNTKQIYSEDEYIFIVIGEYKGHDIYGIDDGSLFALNSRFIKTDKGYLLYTETLTTYAKPVIYLYPEDEMKVDVEISFEGEITCSYPEYNNGWSVLADTDGKLTNLEDGQIYEYLFWEGQYRQNWDLTHGFIVRGQDTADFLKEKLSFMGLEPVEYNEFIVYWLPQMEKNNFNFITFVNDEYSRDVHLDVDPKPDSMIRIFMVYKGMTDRIEVEEPVLEHYERNGFTVVEWGGTCIE
jgi:hypothetical protein